MKKKRAVSDEPIYLTKQFFEQLYLQFTSRHYDYKELKQLKDRDSALCCLLVLAGVRATEVSLLKRKQFKILENKILLLNVKTEKGGDMRPRIEFTKTGALKEFTFCFENWLRQVPSEEAHVFPHGSSFGLSWDSSITRSRVFAIVQLKTGKFPHYLRGVHETYYGETIFEGDAWRLANHMGLKRLDSTRPYVQVRHNKDIEERLHK